MPWREACDGSPAADRIYANSLWSSRSSTRSGAPMFKVFSGAVLQPLASPPHDPAFDPDALISFSPSSPLDPASFDAHAAE